MRVTKEPEVRKQEILDTALKLFGENGYEKTSITDIAKAIGVAQGLCYRYFPSKEALFDSAIEQYADVLVKQFVSSGKDDHKTLRQIIEDMPATMEERDTKYYSVFHGVENKKFQDVYKRQTPGVSHCGIYVGDGRMLHCGDPIGYANLNTSYWQSHFYAYGRRCV